MKTAAALLALLLVAPSAPAQDCFDWGTLIEPSLGTYPQGNTIIALDASGDFLCAAVRTPDVDRLEWFSIADGPEPVRLAIVDFPGSEIRSLRVDGTRAAIARSDGGWSVVDFLNPAEPWLAGARAGGLGCQEIDLQGQWVYSAENQNGLAVYELIGGGVPPERARFDPGRVIHVDVDGELCWLVGGRPWVEGDPEEDYFGYSLLLALDVGDPTAPTEAGRREQGSGYNYADTFGALRVDAGRVVVLHTSAFSWEDPEYDTEYHRRVVFYAAADLPALGSAGAFSHGFAADDLGISGDWAYLLADGTVRYFLAIGAGWSEAGHTLQDGSCLTSTTAGVWVGEGADLHALVPTMAAASPLLATAYQTGFFASTLDAVDGHLLLRETSNYCDFCPPPGEGVRVLDSRDPLDLQPLRMVADTYAGMLGRYAVAGDLLWARTGIWNWRTGAQVGSLPSSVDAVLAVVGDVLWATDDDDVLVFEVSDPAAPVQVGTFLAGDDVRELAVAGDRAVFATVTHLITADVGDPLAPVELQRAPLVAYPVGDMILDDAMLLTADAAGLGVYLLDPDGTLTRIGGLDPGPVVGLALDGPVVYATVNLEGVLAIELSEPAAPVEIGRVELGASPAGVVVQDGHLYVCDGAVKALQPDCRSTVPVALHGFEVSWIDGACRMAWTLAGDPGAVRVLASAGGRTWIVPWNRADGRSVAVDVAARPGETVVYAVQLAGDGGWVTLAQETVEIPVPTLVLHDAVPNPFNPETELRFVLDRSGPVDLAVFDLAGRRVRTLVAEWREAGAHSFSWNGRDDAGRILPSGSYFVRLVTDHGVRSAKAMLLR